MNTQRLLRDLSRPHGAEGLTILQTHISVVCLAGSFVYKVKKPLDLGFLDFTTLEKRLHYCEEEVRLNRRLAASVYIDVVPVVEVDGALVFEGPGEPVEFAVKMRRLPAEGTLLAHLDRREAGERELARLGRRIAEFHAEAASGPEIDRCGGWDVVAGNARENLEQSAAHVGHTISRSVFDRLTERLEDTLRELRPLIEKRAAEHVPRDPHGDLHLQHIYLFPGDPPPDDLIAIDCIEFKERFRFADPVADMAFTVMDLRLRGYGRLAEHFSDAYFRAARNPEGRELLPFYVAYRSAVRAKVEGIAATDPDVPCDVREAARARARAHWLMSLAEVEGPERRPGVVLIGGLPGTGKSTLARELGPVAGMTVISSDMVRKELAGIDPCASESAAFGEGIYSPEWNERTYATCMERAAELLFDGKRVIVDASFREESRRRLVLDATHSMGVPALFLHCVVSRDTARARIAGRRGDASDADWDIYRAAEAAWDQGTDPEVTEHSRTVSTEHGRADALSIALGHMREKGLWS